MNCNQEHELSYRRQEDANFLETLDNSRKSSQVIEDIVHRILSAENEYFFTSLLKVATNQSETVLSATRRPKLENDT